MGGRTSREEEHYWRQRSHDDANERRQRQNVQMEQQRRQAEADEASRLFWHSMEHKFWPAVYELMGKALYGASVVAVCGCLLWCLSHLIRGYLAKQQLKHDSEMNAERFAHENALKHKELEQEASIKLQELQQQRFLKEKQLDQQAKLQEKQLDHDKYTSERNFRLEMGKMYLEMHKEASRNGELEGLSSSMTNFTQNMLIADQPGSSVESITQLSMLATNQSYTQIGLDKNSPSSLGGKTDRTEKKQPNRCHRTPAWLGSDAESPTPASRRGGARKRQGGGGGKIVPTFRSGSGHSTPKKLQGSSVSSWEDADSSWSRRGWQRG